MKFDDFDSSKEKETEGVWVPMDKAEFLIAAHLNPKHRRSYTRLSKQFAGPLRKQDAEAEETVMVESFADGILLNWRGDVELKGQPLPYSRENAITVLRMKPFREWVAQQCSDVALFQKEEENTAQAELFRGDKVAP